MTLSNKFFGLAIKGDYVCYSLIFKDSLLNLGSVDLKSPESDHFSKINSVFSLIKSGVYNEQSDSSTSDDKNLWNIGVYHDTVPNKHHFDNNKFYRLCRIKTIIECSASLTFSKTPNLISETEICKSIAKLSNSKISTIDEVLKYSTERLCNFINIPSTPQFDGIALSWATALALKRRVTLDSLVLGDKDTKLIQERIANDKIVNELINSIKNTTDDKDRLKSVLRRRINKFVEDYVENIV